MEEDMTYVNTYAEPLNLLGIGLVKISTVDSKCEFKTIFRKGISIPLIQNVIELYKKTIITKGQGNSIIPLDDFTIFIHYFNHKEDNIVIIYMDEKEHTISYALLYTLTKQISNQFRLGGSIAEIKNLCNYAVEIPKSKDIIALFILGKNGSPFITKIKKTRAKLSKSEVEISGFISAIYSFSKEIIEQKSGGRLKEINFGNQRFYMIIKNNAIFTFLVENLTPLARRYIYLIADEFLDRFQNKLINFDGDVFRFRKFEEIINQYFII